MVLAYMITNKFTRSWNWRPAFIRQLHLSPSIGYQICTIVYLEMVNILLALRLFAPRWTQCKVRVRCNNQAVVHVLRSGKTTDPFLGACARNIWFWSARFDVDMRYDHIRGTENAVADLLSRWSGSCHDNTILRSFIPEPVWLQVIESMLAFDPEL